MPYSQSFGGRERVRLEHDEATGQITGVMLDARDWDDGIELTLTSDPIEIVVTARPGQLVNRNISAPQRVQMTRNLADPKPADRGWKPPHGMRVRVKGTGGV